MPKPKAPQKFRIALEEKNKTHVIPTETDDVLEDEVESVTNILEQFFMANTQEFMIGVNHEDPYAYNNVVSHTTAETLPYYLAMIIENRVKNIGGFLTTLLRAHHNNLERAKAPKKEQPNTDEAKQEDIMKTDPYVYAYDMACLVIKLGLNAFIRFNQCANECHRVIRYTPHSSIKIVSTAENAKDYPKTISACINMYTIIEKHIRLRNKNYDAVKEFDTILRKVSRNKCSVYEYKRLEVYRLE